MPRSAKWWMVIVIWCSLMQGVQAKDMNLIVTLDRADLQRRIERLFPITREDALVKVRLHHPQVILTEHSDRIGLRLHIDAGIAQQFSVAGRAMVDGVLRYVGDSGKFFLDDASVKELQIDGIPDLYLRQVKQVVDGMVKGLLQDQPIYTLGQRGEPKRFMGSAIKKVTVQEGKLLVELEMP